MCTCIHKLAVIMKCARMHTLSNIYSESDKLSSKFLRVGAATAAANIWYRFS